MRETTAQVDKTIHATADQVWHALTTSESLKKFFFGADVESDWRVGSPIRMTGEFKGQRYQDKGVILASDPQRRLSFSHWSAMSGKPDTPENYHVVTYQLAPEGSNTKVTLTQSNLTGGVSQSDIAHRAEYEKNWSGVLDGLSKLLS